MNPFELAFTPLESMAVLVCLFALVYVITSLLSSRRRGRRFSWELLPPSRRGGRYPSRREFSVQMEIERDSDELSDKYGEFLTALDQVCWRHGIIRISLLETLVRALDDLQQGGRIIIHTGNHDEHAAERSLSRALQES